MNYKLKPRSSAVKKLLILLLALMLFFPAPSLGDSAPDFIAAISTAVILLTTVYSGLEYFYNNRDVFKDSK